MFQRLRVGVDANEIHAFDTGLDHVSDRVTAAAADANHFNDCALVFCISKYKHR
jgi:hypothetical protein